MGKLLVRGMLVGLAAAAFAFVFAYVLGEPTLDDAIAVEESHGTHEHGDAHAGAEVELFSRGTQSTVGLATAVGAYGLAFGGMFSLAFAFAYGRIGNLSARATSAVLGLGAFLVVFLVPYLKYPSNPPAVGDPDTVNDRTTWYFVMVLVSVAVAVLATVVGRRLAERTGVWNAVLLGALGYVVVIGAVALALPRISEVPDGFPAGLLWEFRLASLGTQLVLWTAIALLFGVFTERRVRRVAQARAL